MIKLKATLYQFSMKIMASEEQIDIVLEISKIILSPNPIFIKMMFHFLPMLIGIRVFLDKFKFPRSMQRGWFQRKLLDRFEFPSGILISYYVRQL